MRIEFLVEDASGKILLNKIMEKYSSETQAFGIEYNIQSYKGIGGFGKGSNASDIKSQQLLNDLPKRMKAIQAKYYGVSNVSIFVVLDNDTRRTEEFRVQLNETAVRENISMDYVFCIAVEEMEAWLLGDINAMRSAYPDVSDRIISKNSGYMLDSICGTWECLADILTKGGISKFKKKNPTPFDVGRNKAEWADKIGNKMEIRNNVSPSFRRLLEELDKRRDAYMNSGT